jgi:hypothetical protein
VRCKSGISIRTCMRIDGAIFLLGFWLARHPERRISYNEPVPEDESIRFKGLAEGDKEDADTETAAKAETPWDSDGGVALSGGNVGGNVDVNEEDEEVIDSVGQDAEDDGDQDHEEEAEKSKTCENA